jgi:hypothetical protein
MSDQRRRQYVPLSTTFAHRGTGTRLLDKFGKDGLLVWVCLIAAAKRSPEQGTVELPEGNEWHVLGLQNDPPDFPLTDLLNELGKMKQTSRRAVGRTLYVTLTHFEEWNKKPRNDAEAKRSRRKRATNTADDTRQKRGRSVSDARREVEVEGETPLPPSDKSKSSANGTSPLDPLPELTPEQIAANVKRVKELQKKALK